MKLKTKSSAKKRVKITGTGKMFYKKSSKKHLLKNKSKRQKNLFPGGMPLAPGDARHVAKLLPYS